MQNNNLITLLPFAFINFFTGLCLVYGDYTSAKGYFSTSLLFLIIPVLVIGIRNLLFRISLLEEKYSEEED